MNYINQLMLFDTGIKSRYACGSKVRWEKLHDAIDQIFPNISFDYEAPVTHIGHLEYIGKGDLRKKLGIKQNELVIFPDAKHLSEILPQSYDAFFDSQGKFSVDNKILINLIDQGIKEASNNLKNVFYELEPLQLLEDSKNHRRCYPCHQLALPIDQELEKWEQGLQAGKNGVVFNGIVIALAWDTLFRHEWLTGDKSFVKEMDEAGRLDILFAHEWLYSFRLIKSYLDQRTVHYNLSIAPLLAHLKRIGAYRTFPKTIREWDSRPRSFDPEKELLDVDIIEFICCGYHSKNTNMRHPVIAAALEVK